ncbi:MAG: 16S rRNA (guanine(527)-N(7))-methyltransferase RsmG [Candidatus Thiodiazotropha sp.]
MAEFYEQEACRERLRQGVKALGLAMDENQERLLLQFLALLVKWNRAYNLTAVRQPMEMVGRHLLDSLAVVPHLRGGRCLDIGTGPGLPGIPLAIMCPERAYVLLDSNGKKTRFVRQAVLELGLGNVAVQQQRVEAYRSDEGFDTLIARAFSSLPRIIEMTSHLRRPGSLLLAMKAEKVEQELKALGPGVASRVIPLRVPFIEGERCLIEVSHGGDPCG